VSWPILSTGVVIYVLGLLWLTRTRRYLGTYIWGAFGLTFLGVNVVTLMGWAEALQDMEAHHLATLFALVGRPMQVFEGNIVLIPEATGWTGIGIGIECSTLIESFALTGLVMFYPRLTLQGRVTRTAAGLLATYALNMLRLIVIVMMVMVWGKPVVMLAHAFIGRLIFFLGVVWLFWKLLTIPTLHMIRRDIEVTGRAVT
jgi:exosortase family protein XrtG